MVKQRYLFLISAVSSLILLYLNLSLPKRHEDIVTEGSSGREWMIRREKVYAARKRKIKTVCLQYARDEIWRGNSRGSHFLYDVQHGLAVCMHPKVIYHLWIIRNRKNVRSISGRLNKLEKDLSCAL